jgi:hypothetical protein
MVSIVYSTIWYLYPMLQYYLYLHILHRSLYNSCAQLHAKGLDTERLQCIALNVRSVMRLCDLVNGYYGKPVLLGRSYFITIFSSPKKFNRGRLTAKVLSSRERREEKDRIGESQPVREQT